MREEGQEERILVKAQGIVEHDYFLGIETERKIGGDGRLLQDLAPSLSQDE